MIPWTHEERIETYKEYRAKKFHKYNEKARLLIQGVNDLSLKPEDKRKLLTDMMHKIMEVL